MTMTITLTRPNPQPVQPISSTNRPAGGLRLWTREEYYRMGDMDLFDGARVELLDGQIWEVRSSYLYQWTQKQYDQLINTGFFDDGRVELLGGLIWDMTGQLSRHATAVRLTQLALEDAFDAGFEVRSQLPIVLPNGIEPEPDLAVAPGTPLDYLERHPLSQEVLLAVEISDTTLVKDRGQKLVAYAQGFVSEYWIVNLVNRQLEVYRQPAPSGTYSDFQTYLSGESVAPLGMPNKPISVSDLLPPVKQL